MKKTVFDKDFNLIEVDEEEIKQSLPPILKRIKEYNVSEQLNLLYDDIDQGLFGEQAKTGKFFQYIKEIKEKYPKDI